MLAALPISRCLVEQEIRISESLVLHPPGEWAGLSQIGELSSPTSLPDLAIATSGISPAVIEASALVVFQTDLHGAIEGGVAHKEDLFLLERIVAECEAQLDIARFDLCRLDLPDTLFGRVGTWDYSNGASGCVFLDAQKGTSRIVGGRYLVSTITAGIGLDFYGYQPDYERRKDEIGNVLKQALLLYRHALEASDWTSKYMNCVRLFEVLADPFQLASSNKWEKVRVALCTHLAKDCEHYNRLANRFRYFGNVGVGSARGLRERIFHHGEILENIFDSLENLCVLFKEVQRYLQKIMLDLMRFEGDSWNQVELWRRKRLAELGVSS